MKKLVAALKDQCEALSVLTSTKPAVKLLVDIVAAIELLDKKIDAVSKYVDTE